jgi:nitroreductase
MNQIPAVLGLTSDQVADLLRTAGRAPSVHNTQPWRFRITPDAVELHTDPSRRLPVADPHCREQRLACGAALFNLRLGLRGHGIRPLVSLVPDPERPDLLATIRYGGRKTPDPEIRKLLRAVPRRHTNRHPFSDVPVTSAESAALRRAALDEGAWLHFVTDPAERTTLQQMAARAHRLQMNDPAFRAELQQWTAVSPERTDGVPATSGGPQPAPHERWVKRDFTAGNSPQRAPDKGFETEPAIAVLTSHLSGQLAEIRAGEAMQRVLLTATADGLTASFLSQLVEVDRTRDELRRLIGATRPPQVVLRLGRGWPIAATARRPVSDLIDTAYSLQG